MQSRPQTTPGTWLRRMSRAGALTLLLTAPASLAQQPDSDDADPAGLQQFLPYLPLGERGRQSSGSQPQ
ncbi:hypothetical protein ACVWW5_002380 [Bradyrhizobium sp. LM3.4]